MKANEENGGGLMDLRLATMDDLPQLKAVFKEIIDAMDNANIKIWNEYYPYGSFGEDIERKRLYVLLEEEEIASAFVLSHKHSESESLQWENRKAEALYIDRLGVNVKFARKGIGSLMLNKAIALAREQGFTYVRLFVVDLNEPAINLYIKNGFKKVDGIFDEVIDENHILHEYGFEIKTQR
jgi:ribosomal protein S18 acetylase RimI-like enzyme